MLSTLTMDYSHAIQAVKELLALGAVRVRVGDVEAVFDVPVLAPEPSRQLTLDDLGAEPSAEERLYYSARTDR